MLRFPGHKLPKTFSVAHHLSNWVVPALNPDHSYDWQLPSPVLSMLNYALNNHRRNWKVMEGLHSYKEKILPALATIPGVEFYVNTRGKRVFVDHVVISASLLPCLL